MSLAVQVTLLLDMHVCTLSLNRCIWLLVNWVYVCFCCLGVAFCLFDLCCMSLFWGVKVVVVGLWFGGGIYLTVSLLSSLAWGMLMIC